MAYCSDDEYRKSMYCLQAAWEDEPETEEEVRARKAIKSEGEDEKGGKNEEENIKRERL